MARVRIPIGNGRFATILTAEDVEERISKSGGVKGDKGDTGTPGQDGYTPIKGVDYFDGEQGEPGYAPIKNVDYFDGAKGDKGDPGTTDYNALSNKPTIPTTLSQLNEDITHRVTTDAEKTTWNGKQNALGFTPVNTTDSRLSDARTPTAHTHVKANITDFPTIPTALSQLTDDSTHRLVTDSDHTSWDSKLGSKADVEGVLTGVISTHTHASGTPTAHATTHVTGGSDIIANAVANGNSGLMSGTDKAKLDGLSLVNVNRTLSMGGIV